MRINHTVRGAVLVGLASMALILTGCGDTTTAAPSGSTSPTGETPSLNADWLGVPITDTAGNKFAVRDLVGAPVVVEVFATWCGNCRKQLGDTQKAAAAAGESATFLALSVETELSSADVATYAQKNGFSNIRFAVMSPEMLSALEMAYGKSVLNPPSTPKIVVDAKGGASSMVTGFESPAALAVKIVAAA